MRFGKRAPRDGNGGVANAPIVQAMHAVAVADTPEARAALYRLLLDSTLIAATPHEHGERTMRAGDPLDLVELADPAGPILPVFTDVDALARWRPGGGGYVAMPGRVLLEMAAANDTNQVVVDPGSPTHGVLVRHDIEALARGRLPLGSTEVVAEQAEVRVGPPASMPPPAVVSALRAALNAEPRAVAAWLFLMQQGAGEPELMAAVQLAGGPHDEAMGAVAHAAAQHSEAAGRLGLLVADERWQSVLTEGAGVEFFRRLRVGA
jgi:hypothetical protein